jgi:hypothetical protein
VKPEDYGLVELSEFLSTAEIVALADAFGGTRLYVPTKMTEGHRLAKAIGFAAALRLWNGIGTGDFRVPLARELRASHYRAQGWSRARIARHLGMTETGVTKLLNRMRQEPC